jgi:hypothetical protein
LCFSVKKVAEIFGGYGDLPYLCIRFHPERGPEALKEEFFDTLT